MHSSISNDLVVLDEDSPRQLVGNTDATRVGDTSVYLPLVDLVGGVNTSDAPQGCLSAASTPIVHQVPVEVLIKIFTIALPAKSDSRYVSRTLHLCHICSSWRSVALDYPGFWSTLVIDLDGYSATRDPEDLNNLPELWFRRAKSRPLSITLIERNSSGYPHFPLIFFSLLRNLEYFLHRMEEIHFDVSGHGIKEPFTTLLGGSLPMLSSLTLRSLDPIGKPVYGHVPSLRSAVISLHEESISDMVFPFPWSQLTALDICTPVDMSLFRVIFRECLALERASCTVFRISLDPEWDTDSEDEEEDLEVHLAFEHLLHFRVIPVDSTTGNVIPQEFTFPALRVFEVCGESRLKQPYHYNIHRRVNTDSLRCLLLSNLLVDIDTLCSFLATCHCLEKLAIHFPEIDPHALFIALTRSALTNLTQFAVSVRLEHEEADDQPMIAPLCDLLQSWYHNPQRQRRLEVVTLCIHYVSVQELFNLPHFDDNDSANESDLNLDSDGEEAPEIAGYLREHMRDFIYDPDVNPEGFRLVLLRMSKKLGFSKMFSSYVQ